MVHHQQMSDFTHQSMPRNVNVQCPMFNVKVQCQFYYVNAFPLHYTPMRKKSVIQFEVGKHSKSLNLEIIQCSLCITHHRGEGLCNN